jgi:hypothetical protein
MRLSICVTRPWPGFWTRLVVVVVVVVVTIRQAPGVAIPLGLGGWLGGWLAMPAPALQAEGA